MKRKTFLGLSGLIASTLGVSFCIGIGFSTWVVGNQTAALVGVVDADDNVEVHTPVDLDVISVQSANSFKFAQGYGFVVNDAFENNIDLTLRCSFNAANGKRCLKSYKEGGSFVLQITLSNSLSGGFSGAGFSSDSITISSSNFNDVVKTPTVSSSITTEFEVQCSSPDSDFSFTVTTHIIFANSLTSFPDLSKATITTQLSLLEDNQ